MVNNESSYKSTPIPTSPLIRPSQSSCARVLQAEASIFIAMPIAIKAALDANIFLSSIFVISPYISKRITLIPPKPFASPSQSNFARLLQAETIIFIAAPIAIRATLDANIFLPSRPETKTDNSPIIA